MLFIVITTSEIILKEISFLAALILLFIFFILNLIICIFIFIN